MNVKIQLLIEDAMTRQPLTVQAGDKIEKAKKIMSDTGIRHLPVMKDGQIAGILSEREVSLAEAIESGELLVIDVCSEKPYCVGPKTPLRQVAAEMAKKPYGSALVVEEGAVIGIFTTVDACRILSEKL